MTAAIVGTAWEATRGACYVEPIGNDWFRLIPMNNPFDRLIRRRDQINWRKNAR